MHHVRRLGPLLLLGLLGSGAARTAPTVLSVPQAGPSSTVLPGGIADATGRTGFFASAGGGIEALDLATGKVLWHTHEAQRPLLVVKDHLLAQAGVKRNRLRILRLDLTHKGECDLESDPVVFPAWVVTGEALGRSFSTHWHVEKHQLVLEWEASAWYVGKARPTVEQEMAARKHTSGVALVDLRTGQVEVRPATKIAAPSAPLLPEHLEKKAVRWQGLVGQQWKVLTLEETKEGQHLMFYSWDRQSDKCSEPKELLRGKRLVVRATLDERFLCLREAHPRPDEKDLLTPSKPVSWWWLFSVETGELMGRIPAEPGMHAVVVLGKRVLYLMPGSLRGPLDPHTLQPRMLKAIDLTSGKKLWERAVAGKLLTPPRL
ncbi:MAG TPA: hypothetical protein VN688_28640 [Gemmataceae bacterium]|nr:hypothetical protein [Gemmataceae bacterium]